LRRAAINLLVPILLSWLGAEALGQLYFGNPLYYREQRFTYDTPDAVLNIGPALWTYRPDSEITESIVYKKPFGDYFVESSCTRRTDERGFLDNKNGTRDYDILLLGDSFTAGSAGCGWTDELRQRLPGQTIYNAGLPGTGVPNWAAALDDLRAHGFRFRRVLLLFIADDFYRQAAIWSEGDLACLHDISHCTTENYLYPLTPGIDLAKVSAERNQSGLVGDIDLIWKRRLWVSHFLTSAVGAALIRRQLPIIDQAKAALDHILTAGPAVHLVHIWTKEEAAFGEDNARSTTVANYLGSRGLAVDRCELGYGEFYSYDAHPTREGYAHLAECAAMLVRRL